MNKLTKFIIAVGLQLVVIFFIIIFKLTILTGGTQITLGIEPIDPRSPFRGDYATFQYSHISNIPEYNVVGGTPKNGQTIYVILVPYGQSWIAEGAQVTKPLNNNQIFLKGRVESGGVEDSANINDLENRRRELHIVYGIEEYFIPEGKGRNFSFQNKKALAVISVDDNGNAALKRIFVDGKSWP